MSEKSSRIAYVGVIKNDHFDSQTIVMAENECEARSKVLLKYKQYLGVYFKEEDITISLLFGRNKLEGV